MRFVSEVGNSLLDWATKWPGQGGRISYCLCGKVCILLHCAIEYTFPRVRLSYANKSLVKECALVFVPVASSVNSKDF